MKKKPLHFVRCACAVFALLVFSRCAAPVKTAHYYEPPPLPPVDGSALAGRIIVIDPGHGGAMPGAVGKGGLKEKDVNLKVSLLLRDMLVSAGARVVLTRDTDRDFLSSPKDHVTKDLQRRVEISDSVQPDLFLSVHHNAREASNTSADTTKTFYKMGDAGPSLDAAIKIHEYFTTMLGMPCNGLSIGNYHVLRNTRVPAVLGEPSYISTPAVEAVLRDDAKLRVEAEAYFRGIAEWMKNGVPRILYLDYDSVTQVLDAYVDSDFGLDTNGGEFTLDGRKLPIFIEGKRAYAPVAGTLGNGKHTARLRVSNIRGNSSAFKEKLFVISREPALINAYYDMAPGRPGQIVPVKILVSDAEGMPVMDGMMITTNTDQRTVTRSGRATIYPVFGRQQKISITCGTAVCELSFRTQPGIPVPVQGFVRSEKRPLPAFLTCYPGGQGVSCDENGFFQCPDTIRQAHFSCAGYLDTLVELDRAKINQVELKRLENGIFWGKRIVLDPEFGGLENGGTGIAGERASDINRRIAKDVSARLKRAGADVVLAREEDQSVYPSERVALANDPLADVYVLVRSDSSDPRPYVANYPNSQFGNILTQGIVKAAAGAFSPEARENINYITQQTPCTSVTVSLVPLNSPRPLEQEKIDKAAESIYQGLLYYFKNLPAGAGN